MKFRNSEFWAVTILLSALLALVLVSGAQAAVVIQSQPQSIVAAEGNTAIFTVRATSNRTLRYYWYKNGVMLSNKTSSLTITVSASSAATYSCLVTDGDTKARCADFTVSIGSADPAPPIATSCSCSSGSAFLTWTAPTQRADGTALAVNQIAGYELYHSAISAATLAKKGERISGTAISYTVTGLLPGTHYFALRTIDSNGLLSALSSVFSVTVR